MGKLMWLLFCAGLSGAMLVAALPLANVGLLGPICLAPLLAASRNAGFARGFLAGLGACMFAAWISVEGFFYDPPAHPERAIELLAAWHYVGFLLFSIPIGGVAGVLGEERA